MATDAKITKQLDRNHVQVDITVKNEPYRYFKLPKQSADSFVKEFKKQDKKNNYILNGALIVSILGGLSLASLCTKNIKSSMQRILIKTLGGSIAAIAAMRACGNYVDKQDQNLTKKYHAEEIYYEG